MPATGKSSEEDEHDPDGSRDSVSSQTSEFKDFIVTGGLDDLVKIWDLSSDNTLSLAHQLTGHSLGVVSVAVSSDGKSKLFLKF